MIFFDSHGYPCDQTGDGGDSAVRASILKMCKSNFDFKLSEYEIKPGYFVRHPLAVPWNNFRNLTRDQLMMLIAGLYAEKNYSAIKRIFYARMRGFFFSQSWQRDYVGTWKKPWPHIMRGGDPKDEGKICWFNFADPLFFNHIGALILGGKVYWAYPFLLIAYPTHLFFLFLNIFFGYEQNQMLAECYIYKTRPLNWVKRSAKYWHSKNELEYHEMLRRVFL